MVRRIEGLAERIEFGEPLLGQGIPQLVDRHAEAFRDGAAFGLALGGSEPERERIEAGQEFFEQASGGELTQLLAVTLMAALLILLVGLATENRIAEAGHFAFQFGEAGRGVGRHGLGGRGVGHRIIFRSGVFR